MTLPKAAFLIALVLLAAAILVLSGVKADLHYQDQEQSLRGVVDRNYNNDDSFLNVILRRLVNFDKDQYQSQLEAGLKKRIGFSVGRSSISPYNGDDDITSLKNKDEKTLDNRDLRADTTKNNNEQSSDYTFTPCEEEYECDSTIVTYSREEVYDVVTSVLKHSINVPYCLTADPMITTEMYGSCGVQEDCACPFCLFGLWCPFQVCDSQCYDLSGVKDEVAAAVKHGVQVRKVCASCEEETNHPGFTNQDSDGIGYCDSDAYGYDAKTSGLVVVPTDDEGTILSGALPVSAWAHVTIAGTCDTPSGTFKPNNLVGKVSTDAITTLLMGASGTVSIASDTLGYSNTYDYFKGYIIKKQYQLSFIPLWLKTKRMIAEETGCVSELGNGLTIAGYSEGGYGAFAIAQAAESAGIDVQAVLSGAGPYLTSSALLTTGYLGMAEGTFPSSRRHYTIQLGQSYSSTYRGMENYGTGQDLLADSWLVGTTQYTKNDAISTTTNLGGFNPLNKLVPSPTSIDTLDVWNQTAVKFTTDAMSKGHLKPCDNMTGAVAAGVDKLCDALVSNDLEDYINSIGKKYSYELCFSYDDEVINYANVMQGGPAFTNNAFEVTGNHDEAGSSCIRRFVNFVSSTNFVPQRTGGYCEVNGMASSSSQPGSAPSSKPSSEPEPSASNQPRSAPSSSPSSKPSAPPSNKPSSAPSSSPSS